MNRREGFEEAARRDQEENVPEEFAGFSDFRVPHNNRSYSEKQQETSETKLSSVTLEGVNLSGGLDEPERVEEEILVCYPQCVEQVDEERPGNARPESVRSISPVDSDIFHQQSKHDIGQTRGAWKQFGNPSQDASELLPSLSYATAQGSRHSDVDDLGNELPALQRSLSVPAPRGSTHEIDLYPTSPVYRSAADDDQNVWLMSAAERALAASGSSTSSHTAFERPVPLHSPSKGPVTTSQGSPDAFGSSFIKNQPKRGNNVGFARANSYAPASSRTSDLSMNATAFSTTPHSGLPVGWGQRPVPVGTGRERNFSQQNRQFTQFAAENGGFVVPHPSPGFNPIPRATGSNMSDRLEVEDRIDPMRSSNAYSAMPRLSSAFPGHCVIGGDGRHLFINSVHPDTDIESFRNLLNCFGTVSSLNACKGHDGLLQITAAFHDPLHARAAMASLNSHAVMGRPLDVNVAWSDATFRQKGHQIPEALGRSSSEYTSLNNPNAGTTVVMNFDTAHIAGKVRRNFGAQGHGRSVEFYDVADAERAFRMLKMPGVAVEPARVAFKSPKPSPLVHNQQAQSSGFINVDSDALRSPNNGPRLQHSASEPAPTRVDQPSARVDVTAAGRMSHGLSQPTQPMMPNSAPSPPQPVPRQFQLSLDRILNGDEMRTALMIRNIPNKYNQKMMLQTLETNHRGVFDFFYLPIDFRNKCNVGYAFINFRSPLHIVPFFKEFHGRKWGKFNSEKVCEIAFARIHGKANLIAHFQNSSLMNEDPKCRPIIFGENGEQEEFPVGPHVRTRRGPSARETRVEPTQAGTANFPGLPGAGAVASIPGDLGATHAQQGTGSPQPPHMQTAQPHLSNPGPMSPTVHIRHNSIGTGTHGSLSSVPPPPAHIIAAHQQQTSNHGLPAFNHHAANGFNGLQ